MTHTQIILRVNIANPDLSENELSWIAECSREPRVHPQGNGGADIQITLGNSYFSKTLFALLCFLNNMYSI